MGSSYQKALALSLVLMAETTGGVIPAVAKVHSTDKAEPDLKVIARIYTYARVEPAILALAESQALGILQHAGLTAEWRNISLSSPEATGIASPFPGEPDSVFPDVYLRIVPSSMSPIDSRETLGCALPSRDGHPATDAWVLFDRIEETAKLHNAPSYQLLGDAMAHEIGHLLLGSGAHSVTGVMRANWRSQDYVLMSEGSLFFTPRQAELLRHAVKTRIQQSRMSLQKSSPD